MLNILTFPIICDICQQSCSDLERYSYHLRKCHSLELKSYLFQKNLWPKCLNSECSNPATTIDGKYCSRKCMSYEFATTKEFKEKQSKGLKRFHASKGKKYLSQFWTDEKKAKQKSKMLKIYSDFDFKGKVSDIQWFAMQDKDLRNNISLKATWQRRNELKKKRGFPAYVAKTGSNNNNSNQIIYRNELDKKAFEVLDSNPFIEKWFYETEVICYEFREKNHYIIIDLKIHYKDSRIKLVLIKEKGTTQKELKKLEVIEQYCLKNDYEFEIWTNETFS